MCPTMINGRALGVERNGVFTPANTDPIPGGRLWPEAALTWNAMRAAAIADGIPGGEFVPGGLRSSARSISQQQEFWANRPPPAAFPGTSNHGWGIAVDCESARAQAWIMRNGMRYGWSWDEGRRVGEPWHFRYVGARPQLLRKLKSKAALAHLMPLERGWVREYDRLRKAGGGGARRRELRRLMAQRRKAIWKAAQGPGGWGTHNRRQRYRSLLARTT